MGERGGGSCGWCELRRTGVSMSQLGRAERDGPREISGSTTARMSGCKRSNCRCAFMNVIIFKSGGFNEIRLFWVVIVFIRLLWRGFCV